MENVRENVDSIGHCVTETGEPMMEHLLAMMSVLDGHGTGTTHGRWWTDWAGDVHESRGDALPDSDRCWRYAPADTMPGGVTTSQHNTFFTSARAGTLHCIVLMYNASDFQWSISASFKVTESSFSMSAAAIKSSAFSSVWIISLNTNWTTPYIWAVSRDASICSDGYWNIIFFQLANL